MRRLARRLIESDGGAVAPTVALSLFVLIAASGVAYDYARLASMDTELQNAADQAALAAASQLDGGDDACARAAAAAAGMVENLTIMANDGGPSRVTVTEEADCDAAGFIRFYQDIGKTIAASTGAEARFVEVEVNPREAFYALTPLVAAFSSGPIPAIAFAGLGEAICNTPPVMMCNPAEPNNNADPDYPFTADVGDGIRLVIGSPSTPGNFGFLQTGFGTGAADLARALGYNTPPADCAATNGVDTEPGDKQAVRAAFNTRFDLSESGLTCPSGGTCSPSQNVRKDLVRGNNCGSSGNQGWQEASNPYRPTSPTVPLDGTNDPAIMGHPRDMCHAVSYSGVCETDGDLSTVGDLIGDGEWDRDAYFRVNYGWMTQGDWTMNTGLDADATRFEVYKWELENPPAQVPQAVAGGKNGYHYPTCRPPGVIPDEDTPDRRRMAVAVINCKAEGLGGREFGVQVLDWIDVFMVEPAFRRDSGNRTGDGDIYVEVIGKTRLSTDNAFQVVKKAVPYLIE